GVGDIGAAAGVDVKSGAFEQRDRRLLQTPFGNSDSQLHWATSAVLMASGSVKHDFVPVWQTKPSPSTKTRRRIVSRSQSVRAEITRRRLPEVSPLVQSFCRVRE